MPIPSGADMFDVVLPNGLTLQMIEPLKRHRHIYNAEGCAFDLTFTADRAPHAMLASEGEANEGLSEFVGEVGESVKIGHFEQSGVMNGSLVVNGERIDVVNAATLRDRSWGPRPMVQSMNKSRGALVFARQDADNCFQAWFKSALPWETDPRLVADLPSQTSFKVSSAMPSSPSCLVAEAGTSLAHARLSLCRRTAKDSVRNARQHPRTLQKLPSNA